jgi:hypothetical protein
MSADVCIDRTLDVPHAAFCPDNVPTKPTFSVSALTPNANAMLTATALIVLTFVVDNFFHVFSLLRYAMVRGAILMTPHHAITLLNNFNLYKKIF